MGSADSYVEKKDADEGKLPLPDWFTAIEFGSWNCTQVSERITLDITPGRIDPGDHQ